MYTRAQKLIFNDSALFNAYMAGQDKARRDAWMYDALISYAAGDIARATQRVKNARFFHKEYLRHMRSIK
jgi:hypothetical protein